MQKNGSDMEVEMSALEAGKPRCRLCGAVESIRLGSPAYRKPPSVAGVAIKVDDLDLGLFKCPACAYYFISPEIPRARLAACYEASTSHWDTGENVADRRSYGYKCDLISKYAPGGRRFLNVGCYDGGFEEFLDGAYECFGVEPSANASAVAARRGIRILGLSVDDLDERTNKFDVIVLFDVAEHIVDPVRVFGKLRRMLVRGGIIMFETGNMDAFPWPELITLNPYCAVYDHVGFFNMSSVERLSALIGLKLVHFEPTVHTHITSPIERFERWCKVQLYWAIRRAHVIRIPMPLRLNNIACGPVPVPPIQQDHFIAIMKDGAA